MEQKLVYLHTEKNLEETEEILKQQGMEIIVQVPTAYLSFDELTEEEKKSYLLEVEKDLMQQFISNEAILAKFRNQMKSYDSFKKSVFESLKTMKKSPTQIRNSNTYAKYSDCLRNLGYIFHNCYASMEDVADPLGSSLRSSGRPSTGGVSSGPIRCSLLVAKKGDNIVRYLSFMTDPVLTITGPDAKNMKSTLEGKF